MKKISIVTDASPELGMGHLQRMASLCNFINSSKDYTAKLICLKKNNKLLNHFPEEWTTNNIPKETDIIIKDSRDSTITQINKLKEIAPTIVIDDNGNGRNIADIKIDILPNLIYNDTIKGKFLYGYNFIKSLSYIKDSNIKKIDLAIYETDTNKHIVKTIINRLSHKFSIAILGRRKIEIVKNNNTIKKISQEFYSTILSKSDIVITHFGIMLYEANLLHSHIITIDPSDYHYSLSKSIKDNMKITTMGTISKISINKLLSTIENKLSYLEHNEINLIITNQKINSNLLWYKKLLDKF